MVNAGMKNRCFKILRKVSPAHGILPKSYHLSQVTLSDTIPYASGGFADIWKGQLDGRQVCIKAFRTQAAANLDKIKRVRGRVPNRGWPQSDNNQRFYREIIGWKYVVHQNVVPFSGISETLFSFCIVNPWLPNGNILEYTRKNKRVNRLKLVSDLPGSSQTNRLNLPS
jgi:serine/threonine protein kinase